MRDLNDPKTRAEQETYIRQLEGQNQLPSGLKILRPKPSLCVKVEVEGEKSEFVFVNICTSKHVEEAKPQTVTRDGMMGTSWSIPYSMGPRPRSALDKDSGKLCTVMDTIFNTKSMKELKPDPRLLDLVVKTAIEGVSRVLEEKLDSSSYEVLDGVKCMGGDPPSLSLRDPNAAKNTKADGKKADPLVPSYEPSPIPQSRIHSKESKDKKHGETKTATGIREFNVGDQVVVSGLKSKPEYNGKRGTITTKLSRGRHRVSLSGMGAKAFFINVKPANLKKSPKTNATTSSSALTAAKPTASAPADDGKLKPEYTITERGSQAADQRLQFTSERFEVLGARRPQNLVVRIKIPQVKNTKDMDLDIDEKRLKFHAEPYALDILLPYPVLPDNGSAKYKKICTMLVVTLPIKALSQEEVAKIQADHREKLRQRDEKRRKVGEEWEAKERERKLESQKVATSDELDAPDPEDDDILILDEAVPESTEKKVEDEKDGVAMAAEGVMDSLTNIGGTSQEKSTAPKVVELLPEEPNTSPSSTAGPASIDSTLLHVSRNPEPQSKTETEQETFFSVADVPMSISLAAQQGVGAKSASQNGVLVMS
uniref:PIH1 domain-containing protein 1 n=1 Tax=Lotharella globosa TaxID=91324 RepID=A0A7S3ZG55_9EUKA